MGAESSRANAAPSGLLVRVYPDFFQGTVDQAATFGTFTNCFTFMIQSDMACIGELAVRTLRPEDKNWTDFQTRDDWINEVRKYFSNDQRRIQFGSVAHRLGSHFLL